MKDEVFAVVVAPFPGVKDGEIYPTDLVEGDIIQGALAAAAVSDGHAEEVTAEEVSRLMRGADEVALADLTMKQLMQLIEDEALDIAVPTRTVKADLVVMIESARASSE